ncbi:S8 family peptidase [Actinophytocola oryzae]|uniref:Subtilase family protein n=1 Tax=Actinophytocola oryzae TaxID=502181 RepID=A0A4V3FR54_9PSEU|nr:S8 family peptidase [Actinophytocola oryzae]TDV42211.1 subtilase family protein [Actinophytocola oryzae]
MPTPSDRLRHGQRLRGDLERAAQVATTRRQRLPIVVDGAIDGFYATFDSFPGLQLALTSLDPRRGRRHPELMSVQEIPVPGSGVVERATVFVPEGTVGYFLDRLTAYADSAGMTTVRHRALVDPIQSARLATIEALWTDPPGMFPPAGRRVWWEVWLRRRDGHELDRLRAFAQATGARVGRQHLGFGDRIVVLVQAGVEQLAGAVDVLDDLAELRAPSEPAIVLARMPPAEQREWVDDLLARLEPAGREAPSVCVVDSGVFRDHLLLESSLDTEDCHAADPLWPVCDDYGHGTEMAGLALFGDLAAVLSGSTAVRLTHRLESVKILPPPPAHNSPELYAAVTVDGIARAEIQAPYRRRVHSLAVTAPQPPSPKGAAATPVMGQPSSWSAALDAFAVGRSVITNDDGLEFVDLTDDAGVSLVGGNGQIGRLFVVSVGNIRTAWQDDHLDQSDLQPVEDPAQAWNVVTVGAFTERDSMADAPAGFAGWTPLAAKGSCLRSAGHP